MEAQNGLAGLCGHSVFTFLRTHHLVLYTPVYICISPVHKDPISPCGRQPPLSFLKKVTRDKESESCTTEGSPEFHGMGAAEAAALIPD